VILTKRSALLNLANVLHHELLMSALTYNVGLHCSHKPHDHTRLSLKFELENTKEARAQFLVDNVYSQWLAQCSLADNERGMRERNDNPHRRTWHDEEDSALQKHNYSGKKLTASNKSVRITDYWHLSNVYMACKQISTAHLNKDSTLFEPDAAKRLASRFSFTSIVWKQDEVKAFIHAKMFQKLEDV